MKVTIVHPDLGIGGAERLIVDAALALKAKGHSVRVVTNHYDPSHAFKETETLDIRVINWWFPRSIFGMAAALCAYIRMCLAALVVCACYEQDVILSDQVSASQSVLRVFSRARLVFYCHFPDLLLTDRNGAAKSAYRYLLDSVEERTTGMCDAVCVNSMFTAGTVRKTFPSLSGKDLFVLYPSLNTAFFDAVETVQIPEIPSSAEHVFVSLNRFEVKKNVGLALEAFAELKSLLSAEEFSKCFLVVAGGYDKLNQENRVHFSQLVDYAHQLGVQAGQVAFIKSPPDSVKVSLLRMARAVLYTPEKEHFGIVPVEAMYLGRPVIAVRSGGPKESIADGETGYLVGVEDKVSGFARHMCCVVRERETRQRMEKAGPDRVRKLFAFDAFATTLDRIIKGETEGLSKA